MSYDILDRVNSPEDLRALPKSEMPALCSELREFLIEKVSAHGGHLSSNLGTTELCVAIHRVFDTPSDHVIFDVGHQAYVHKIITGRKAGFDTLRATGGLSGFTNRAESEYDPFGAGHSSTALSASLGFAEADKLDGKKNYTVCVMGDGAYTGGMVHEALNNCKSDLRLVIVLNENRMSISKNRGLFARYIAKCRASAGYMRFKRKTNSGLKKLPLIGKPIHAVLAFVKNFVKRVLYSKNYFEELGFDYIGPVDGNDYAKLENVLREAKLRERCVIVHIMTKKGKGYEPAEKSPDDYHSVRVGKAQESSFHVAFSDALIDAAKKDESIVGVTAAMGIGTGMEAFGKAFKDRYFDVGIAEEHALTFSAGLAAAGKRPFTAIYSTFLQRAYDNILHDVALQKLPVVMAIDRAGLAVSDGATHHGIFDVSFLSGIPGIGILAPATYGSLAAAVRDAAHAEGPIAIRYPNAPESVRVRETFYPEGDFENYGVRADFAQGETPKKLLITYGGITERVLAAKDILQARGERVGVILLESLRPYREIAEKLLPYTVGAEQIVFVEEGILSGGAGMNLLPYLEKQAKVSLVAIDDNFAKPDRPCDLYDAVGLSPEKIAAKFTEGSDT